MFSVWWLRLFLTGLLLCLCFMISSLAERRIHSADAMELSGGMLGGRIDRSLILQRSQARRKQGVAIQWCKHIGLKAAPGPVTALASFPGSGNTWLRYLLQQVTGKRRD